jgi:hypothetical protein
MRLREIVRGAQTAPAVREAVQVAPVLALVLAMLQVL